jgi:hypothetical protein
MTATSNDSSYLLGGVVDGVAFSTKRKAAIVSTHQQILHLADSLLSRCSNADVTTSATTTTTTTTTHIVQDKRTLAASQQQHPPMLPPWLFSFQQRVQWGSSIGTWISAIDDDDDENDDSDVACVAHLVSSTTPGDSNSSQVEWRLQLWLIDMTTMIDDTPTTDDDWKEQQPTISHFQQLPHQQGVNLLVTRVMERTSQILLESLTTTTTTEVRTDTVKLTCAALDRQWLPFVQHSLVAAAKAKHFSLELDYVSHCGLWGISKAKYFCPGVLENDVDDSIPAAVVSEGSSTSTLLVALKRKTHNQLLEQEGFRIRPLTVVDASLVNSKWEYRSNSSLQMIKEMIGSSGGSDDDAELSSCSNWGIEELHATTNGGERELVAWILHYPDGPLGMLYCLDKYRQRGFGAALVQRAMYHAFVERGESQLFAYILDANVASGGLFSKLGWNQQSCADWVGITLLQQKKKKEK